MIKCDQLFPPPSADDSLSFSRAKELQGILLQHGADPCHPYSGSDPSEDILFSYGICGGSLQVYLVASQNSHTQTHNDGLQNLLPLYLSRCPNIYPERVDTETGYTRLLAVCSSTYDPYGNKATAVRSLIQKGANARARCEIFGNSALHLALLSARDKVIHRDGQHWGEDSEQLRDVLVCLLRHHAEVNVCNHAGFTPADCAIALKCVKSWNNAMQDCGFIEHLLDASNSTDLFCRELDKQFKFDKFWDDYHHFSSWRCHPDSCFLQARWFGGRWVEQCPWWDEYPEWLLYWKWDVKKIEWQEL